MGGGGGGGETLVGKSSRRHKGGNNVQESVSEGERGRERERESNGWCFAPNRQNCPRRKIANAPQPTINPQHRALPRQRPGAPGVGLVLCPKSSKLPTDSKIANAPKPTISPQHRVLARTRPGTPGFGLMLCPKSSKLPPEKMPTPRKRSVAIRARPAAFGQGPQRANRLRWVGGGGNTCREIAPQTQRWGQRARVR